MPRSAGLGWALACSRPRDTTFGYQKGSAPVSDALLIDRHGGILHRHEGDFLRCPEPIGSFQLFKGKMASQVERIINSQRQGIRLDLEVGAGGR